MNDELSVWKGNPVPDDMFLQLHIAVYYGLGCALQELPRPKRPSLTGEDQLGVERAGEMLFEMSSSVQQLGMSASASAPARGKDLGELFVRIRPMLEQLAQVTEYSPNDLADRIAVRRVKEAIASMRRELKKCIDSHLANLREKEQPCPQPTHDACAIPAETDHTSGDPSCADNVKTDSVEPPPSSDNGNKNTEQQDTK